MTRDEILNMPAGEELDALIAEKVMEHSVRKEGTTYWEGFTTLARYSTDIAQAWKVVEKMEKIANHASVEDNIWTLELSDNGGAFAANFRNASDDFFEKYDDSEWWSTRDGEFDISLAPTAPLAICRAALLVVVK